MEISSRFATSDEIYHDDYQQVDKRLLEIHREYGLTDHTALNKERCSWYKDPGAGSVFYASRMWEYPFAILSAEIKPGMKCADIGCGTTPFTPYLCELAGKENVTGFDPDPLQSDDKQYYAFGVKKSFLEKAGFNFQPDNLADIHSPDESFDRVFCISVLEHIEQRDIQYRGIREMARILKPGGRLILTIDLGIQMPLTNPFGLIQMSGLNPCGVVNFSWPEKRFLNVDKQPMDVFGLVLEKSARKIQSGLNGGGQISEFEATRRFAPEITKDSTLQMQKDLKNSGKLKVLSKLLLGKY